jgi:hypothetical protein
MLLVNNGGTRKEGTYSAGTCLETAVSVAGYRAGI